MPVKRSHKIYLRYKFVNGSLRDIFVLNEKNQKRLASGTPVLKEHQKLYNLQYDYLFNIFSKPLWKGKTAAAATLSLEFQFFYKGDRAYFVYDTRKEKEPPENYIPLRQFINDAEIAEIVNFSLHDFFSVNFNPETGFSIIPDSMLTAALDGDFHIGITPCNFTIDTEGEPFKGFPCMYPNDVSPQEFMDFLIANKKDFDITDNIHAQSPSYGYRIIELKKE